ncbi:MAG: helix-turn-helix domain-containing protein [Rhodobacteraceae bacterium]|jgi:HTH-type transcriptional regulator, cell division transcriptional repressor|nr:transcriptional regulator [Paracoccaceae bacterium]MBT4285058.1 helix-turn-helix domain-containing protein [Paracoccaceae bacterium]MBT4776794.1 helix-turn-helix domain-containing protein [Paracoccaceae bacterium]MBT6272343.1 helix-turn-helix domain-containing protein [Paracoccaceae bacterium]MBT6437301.1 helix-turn-helix domain-containing protein [Paracoccaceae bacterium]|tara:strand:- start:502 stop:903 length:402 start_codon:yes stop_codon:yes gene_type:complete
MESLSENNYYANDNATFGDRIYAAREAVGLSQSALAIRLGVQLKTVKKWEEDITEPRANKLQMISGLLNISITWLLIGEGIGPQDPESTMPISADLNEILVELRHTKSELLRLTKHLDVVDKKLRKLGNKPSE